jgi:methylmalonyl-CoA mutase
VGVNRFEGPAVAEPEVRVVDSGHVLEAQRARLESLRSNRDGGNVASALAALQAAAREGRGNLLEAAIQCMRARSTVGEVSATLESVWGRYVADKTSVTGVFAAGYGDDGRFGEAQARARRFLERTGRRPRLLVAKLGQDGHDRGAKVIAAGFADAGFDVDLAPLFQTPEEVARAALDHDVHVVGISTQAGAHASLVPELVECLRSEGAKDVLVVCGGIVPERDRARLLARGVAAVFTPGTQVITCVEQVLSLLEGNTGG